MQIAFNTTESPIVDAGQHTKSFEDVVVLCERICDMLRQNGTMNEPSQDGTDTSASDGNQEQSDEGEQAEQAASPARRLKRLKRNKRNTTQSHTPPQVQRPMLTPMPPSKPRSPNNLASLWDLMLAKAARPRTALPSERTSQPMSAWPKAWAEWLTPI